LQEKEKQQKEKQGLKKKQVQKRQKKSKKQDKQKLVPQTSDAMVDIPCTFVGTQTMEAYDAALFDTEVFEDWIGAPLQSRQAPTDANHRFNGKLNPIRKEWRRTPTDPITAHKLRNLILTNLDNAPYNT